MEKRQLLVSKHQRIMVYFNKHPTDSHKPLLLALQQLVVCSDLDVQCQLEVHQLLVFADLSSQVLFGPLQGFLQLGDVAPGLLQVLVAVRPGLVNFLLQGFFLIERKREAGWADRMCAQA